MKAQLLEDIGDSHPPLPPPVLAHAAQVEAGPDHNTASNPPAQSAPRPSNAAPSSSAATASARLPPQVAPQAAPDRLARWGRRTASGTAVLLLVVAVSGAGFWWYKERKVDQALSVLARAPMPARHVPTASAALAQASDPQAAQQALPPPTMPVAPAATEPLQPVADTPPPLADDQHQNQDQSQDQTQDQNPAPPIAATTEAMRRNKPSARTSATSAAPTAARSGHGNTRRNGPLAETLRLCRAAGYHAAQCIQLDCTATQYGLACKGARNVRR